jgi:tetratricopeptide (TPR) repeat protein
MKPGPESENVPLERKPLLVGEDDTIVRPDLGGEKEAATGAGPLDVSKEDLAEREKSEVEPDLPGPAWQGVVFAMLPVLICLFGAGREAWSKGLAAILLGLALLIFPVRRSLPPFVTLCFFGALLAPLTALLPADTLLTLPEWRTALVEDWGIILSSTLSPQAGMTLEAWILFALCVVWLYWGLARGFSQVQRRVMLEVLALGGVTLSVLAMLDAWDWVTVSWWPGRKIDWAPHFGAFANRNHTSSLAAITAVLCTACAVDAYRRKRLRWWWFAVGFLLSSAAIFSNTSRAGLVLLFTGFTLWLGTSAMGRGFFKKMTVTISVVLIISTLLVLSSGGLAARLSQAGDQPDLRLLVFARTLEMILRSPWLGIGLGNFEGVYSQFQGVSRAEFRTIHPESDYLWIISEGGLLTLLPCVIVMVWFFGSTGPWFRASKKRRRSSSGDRRLRNAASVGLILSAVHGLVDVPNHGLGYWSWVVLLAGIAVRPRSLNRPAPFFAKAVIGLGGLAVIGCGAAWLAVASGMAVMPGESTVDMLRERANRNADAGAFADALIAFDDAIEINPMDYRLYHERAVVRIRLGHVAADVMADFSRSRALQSNDWRTCFREGLLWLEVRPEFAVIPWRTVLVRRPDQFSWMLQLANAHPELREPLWDLANTADLKVTYLDWVTDPVDFERCLRSILETPGQADLSGLEPAQRSKLFRKWYELGNKDSLVAALETNRQWREIGWRILAEHYARESQFERACTLVSSYLPSMSRSVPGAGADVEALERALLYNPMDPRRSIDLFQAQKAHGKVDDAIRTLEKILKVPGCPAYVRQEIAALYVMKEDYRRAWEYLRDAMNAGTLP